MNTKICTRCGKEKSLDQFNKHSVSPDGHTSECKACFNNRAREYRRTHVEQIRLAQRTYRENHVEELKQKGQAYREAHTAEIQVRHQAYYEANAERILAKHKQYYEAHQEEHRARNHRWYILHRDHCLAVCRRYYEAHRADKAAYDKLYRGRNLERRRMHNRRWARANAAYRRSLRLNREAQKRANGGHVSVREWLLLKEAYGNKCAVPGCDRTDVTMDHIIPLALGGRHSIENIQPLCVYHNSSKGTQIIDYRKS